MLDATILKENLDQVYAIGGMKWYLTYCHFHDGLSTT